MSVAAAGAGAAGVGAGGVAAAAGGLTGAWGATEAALTAAGAASSTEVGTPPLAMALPFAPGGAAMPATTSEAMTLPTPSALASAFTDARTDSRVLPSFHLVLASAPLLIVSA